MAQHSMTCPLLFTRRAAVLYQGLLQIWIGILCYKFIMIYVYGYISVQNSYAALESKTCMDCDKYSLKVFMKQNFRLWIFWGPEYCEHICFWFQQLGVPFISFSKTAILGKKASGPRAARTACVTSLVRVCHSKNGILKQWESELESSSDILQCLNAVSSYKVN